MPCYVYVLRSETDGALYIGITKRLQRRVQEHNLGQSSATRARRPWTPVDREVHADHLSARGREVWLKSGEGRE